VGMIPPVAGRRWSVAIDHAWFTNSACIWVVMDHPTTAREPRSSTTASYSQPSPVGRYVMSPTYTVSGMCTVHSRLSWCGAPPGLGRARYGGGPVGLPAPTDA
jgi:hypothetical protein